MTHLGPNRSHRLVVVSLAPQVRASVAACFKDTISSCHGRLTRFFKDLGADVVLDTSFSREVVLREAAHEFITKYRASQDGNNGLPILTSACPGWVCYAEKRHGDYVLPHISKVKSPQQVMGTVVKQYLSLQKSVAPAEIYHVSVMPCFDKKLEASRSDFVVAGNPGVPEVDCVITSLELVELMESRGVDYHSLESAPHDRLFANISEDGVPFGNPGGSGGYAEYIYRQVAKQCYDMNVADVKFEKHRNIDFKVRPFLKMILILRQRLRILSYSAKVATLTVDGKKVLSVAITNGFRNMQNVLRQAKSGKCRYDYVEIMACPGGCLNGGAQLHPAEGETGKELLGRVDSLYHSQRCTLEPGNPVTDALYKDWLGEVGGEKAKRYLHTDYHNIPDNVGEPLAIKW